MKNIVQFPKAVIGGINDPAEWGGCPKCHRNDGYLNAEIGDGMGHWFYCKMASTEMAGRDRGVFELATHERARVEPWYPTA